MPFVDISLARGKSPEYLQAVSRTVHDALVSELSMQPDDDFQLIHQLDSGEMVFSPDFRGGPRSGDWIVFKITEGIDRGQAAKRRFYRALTDGLAARPGVRPADVFVMFYLTPAENFSFADGTYGPDVAAREALAADAQHPGQRGAYAPHEMAYAVTELLERSNRGPIAAMLRDDVVLRLPLSLPYGGEITGAEAFSAFFSGLPGGDAVWESFTPHVDQIITSDHHLIAQLTNTAVPKATGEPVVFNNVWIFETPAGRIASAQLYADTAAVGKLPR
jgi:ketosteroid isomerase-like protein